ncbi:MAG TPA: hypothetical protein VLZ53_07920, partial [Devosia sp.]|nr:hypothetical protein [Devosia sp.]
IKVLETIPELSSMINVGAVLLSDSTFMRTEIDKAITDLVDDGTMAEILAANGYDLVGARPGGF